MIPPRTGAETADTKSAAPEDIPALTSLRFFAAMGVVMYHFAGTLEVATREVPVLHALIAWSHRFGYLGVSWFFVLSGFILTHVYLGPSRPGPVNRRRFWAARFARIYPAYFLAFLLAAWMFVLGESSRFESGEEAALHVALAGVPALLLVHAWFAAWIPMWNFPSWSVAVEAFFYATFPWLAPALRRLPVKRRVWVAVAAWLLGLVLPVLYTLTLPDGVPLDALSDPAIQGFRTRWLLVVKWCPLLHLQEFVIGIAAGLFFVERDRSRDARLGPRLALGGLVLSLLGTVLTDGRIPYPLLHDGLLAPAFAMIIYGVGCGGRLGRWFSHPSLVLLGEASYAVYILQVPVDDLVTIPLAVLRPDLSPAISGAVGIFAIVAAAIVVYRSYERPLRRRIVSWLTGPPPPSPSPSPSLGGAR